MKTSKIIFSMLFIAGVLLSMTSNAQTRVTINAGIIAPPYGYPYPPNNGYVYYGPQPGYYAPYGGYYAPRGHYRPAYGYQHQAYHNHPHYGNGNRNGSHYGNRNHY
ncbi:MAG: hypothetical protein JWM14_2139 [Chitinophagaceae bacterium]|nr:hypothetical protein [Chitinophagaceae bacterium]